MFTFSDDNNSISGYSKSIVEQFHKIYMSLTFGYKCQSQSKMY